MEVKEKRKGEQRKRGKKSERKTESGRSGKARGGWEGREDMPER